MSEIREIVKEKINQIKKEISSNTVRVTGARYFVVLKNGEILDSDSDINLNNKEFNYAVVYQCVNYYTLTYPQSSYLSPITINNKLKVEKDVLYYKTWILYFEGQSLNHRPNDFSTLVQNHKINFSERIIFNINQFTSHLKLLNLLINCNTEKEAEFIYSYYKKDKTIKSLNKEIFDLEKKLEKEKLEIENLKNILKTVSELVTP